MDQNPYQPPQSFIRVNDQADLFNGAPIPAGKWLRFFNYFIDIFGNMGFGMVIGFILGITGGVAAVQAFEDYSLLAGILMNLVYYTLMEGMFGRTLGKLVTGTKVVNERGGKPTVGQVFGRTFCRLIPFEAFSFLGETGRGWHDSITGTYVVKCR